MGRHMERMFPGRAGAWLWLLGVVCLAAAGCGDGLGRYRITGTVMFEGKPVEFGAIFFEPTASVGKVAPTAYIPVRDGKYDTGDKGPIAGRYVVKVHGEDRSKKHVDDDGVTHTAQLFNDYVFEVEIPLPNGRLDVEVPASQAIKQR